MVDSKNKIGQEISWIVPTLRSPNIPRLLWNVCSSITVSTVGCLSKLYILSFNKFEIYNAQVLHKAMNNRSSCVPLITISNHYSCFDDPGLWVMLQWKTLLDFRKMRWSLAAHDICFTNRYHSYFFMFGKCVPIIRGHGVFQEAVNFCIERLAKGEWLHIFPEGKVNVNKEVIRLKWGVGRMIYESPMLPIVIPVWHIGMEEILPNKPPYFLRAGKKLTVNVGHPIDFREIVAKMKNENVSAETARKVITDVIQNELLQLRKATEILHQKRN